LASIEGLSDIDILVSPANTHFEVAMTFKSSVSACLRRAAATKNEAGGILHDVVGTELTAWMNAHGRVGLPVAPGTVAPTGAGELGRQGIRRIYHAAVVTPRAGTSDYDTDPAAVARAVRGVFALARAERARFGPPLESVCLPLLGAGRGGLPPMVSLSWIWAALDGVLAGDGRWRVHLVARRPEVAEEIVDRLVGGGRRGPPTG
jgi:hypothetical protein